METGIDKENWAELVRLLQKTEQNMNGTMLGNGSSEEIGVARESLGSFRAGVHSLGLSELERAAGELESYLVRQIEPAGDQEAAAVFSFAVSALMEQMSGGGNGFGEINVDEVLEILGPPPDVEVGGTLTESDFPPGCEVCEETAPTALEETAPLADGTGKGTPDLMRLEQIVSKLGGKLSVGQSENGPGPAVFTLSFPVTSTSVDQIETLLAAGTPSEAFAPALSDDKYGHVIALIQDFMVAFSSGDIAGAQEILLRLADHPPKAGLYKEIGGLARELHTSLRSFVTTLDPALKNMVEDKLPDSSNRLEHMLELTEKAANTTIDQVLAIQERIDHGEKLFGRLDEMFGGLHALGAEAHKRLDNGKGAIEELRAAAKKNSGELDIILTAQDYQDLTGQIIQKITQLLKDLERKLVNTIRTFGVPVEEGKKVQEEELYGPVHKEVKEALHSQDDVDALLAEFGF